MDLRDMDFIVAVPLVLVGLAVLGALLRHFRSRRGGADESLETAALRARHDVLKRQLRELEEGVSGRSPDVLAEERAALEQVAAQVRQELEARGVSPGAAGPGAAPGEATASGGRRWARLGSRKVIWAAGGMLLLALVILSAAQASRPRRADDTVVALRPSSPAHGLGSGPSVPAGPEESAARATLDRNPEDIEARLELARLRLDQEDWMAVWAETEKVLKQSAGNPRALTYQSQVRLAMGQPDVALAMLKEALAKDPRLLQAYVYVSYVYLRVGQTRDAEEVIAETKRRFPSEAAALDRGFAQMKASLVGQDPLKMGEANPHAAVRGGDGDDRAASPHAGWNPHLQAASLSREETPAARGGSGAQVSGTLELEGGASGPPRGGVVFVTAREAGFGAGPPLAAKKLEATSFPLSFALGDADSMQGTPLPARILLEARLDADGDPLTKDKTEPVARQDDVRLGAKGIRLVLRPR